MKSKNKKKPQFLFPIGPGYAFAGIALALPTTPRCHCCGQPLRTAIGQAVAQELRELNVHGYVLDRNSIEVAP